MKPSKVKRKAQGGLVDSAPEQAIANTVRDPQAARMLELDLAKYALMNQPQQKPQRMAEGGIMNDIYNNVIPAQVRTYAETMLGNRSPITENNFSSSELDMMREAIALSRRDRTVTNNRLHQEQLAGAKNDKERMNLLRQGQSPTIDQTVGYQHYPNNGDDSVRGDNSIDYDAAVRNTLGRFAYNKDADGNLIATDTYKFRDDLPGQTRPTSEYAKMSTAQKLGTLLNDSFGKDGDIGTLLSRAGSAFIGADGRPVNVNLGKASFAEGGTVTPAPYFIQGEQPFSEFRHQIGMNKGGQGFDVGGEVNQPSLDQMRYELERNSPVMQATPRGSVQDFIGTVGGYMDRAGKFVSEAIEPTAEKHPVKHFLANMLLADSLKGAGTALQDYTGTIRETDEDNPVRGLISKDYHNLTTSREPLLDPRALDLAGFAAPVVKGATKLAGAGVKAITPFATRVDDMVRELNASGAMPQPGLSIEDVTPKENTLRLYHGSPEENLTEVNNKGLFGGIFGTTEKQAAESHGNYLHYVEIPENKILSHYALNYEIPYEEVNKSLLKERPDLRDNPELHEKVWNLVIGDRGQNTLSRSNDELIEMFNTDDYGDAGFEAQKLRGKISKNLGYHAVELEDEHGTSYLINSGVKLNKKTLQN